MSRIISPLSSQLIGPGTSQSPGPSRAGSGDSTQAPASRPPAGFQMNEASEKAFFQSVFDRSQVLVGTWMIGSCGILLVCISEFWMFGNQIAICALSGVRLLAIGGAGVLFLRRQGGPDRNLMLGKYFEWYAKVICGLFVLLQLRGDIGDESFVALCVIDTSVTVILGVASLAEKQVLVISVLFCYVPAILRRSSAETGRIQDIVSVCLLGLMALKIVTFIHIRWETLWLMTVRSRTTPQDQTRSEPGSPGVPAAQPAITTPAFRPLSLSLVKLKARMGPEGPRAKLLGSQSPLRVQNMKDFERLREISQGAQGVVHEVKERQTGLYFALKLEVARSNRKSGSSDPVTGDASPVTSEMEILQDLQHPHIVRCFGFVNASCGMGILLELCDVTVGHLIHGGSLPEAVVGRLVRQLVAGLCYIHDRGIVHNDLKTSNLLIKNNNLKIADFGSAWAPSVSTRVSLKATPHYMAPEQVTESVISRKSDVWALGCCTMEMLTTLLPCDLFLQDDGLGLDRASILYSLARLQKVELPEVLQGESRDFIEQCFKVDVDQRASAMTLMTHGFLSMKSERRVSSTPEETISQLEYRVVKASSWGSSDEGPDHFTGITFEEVPSLWSILDSWFFNGYFRDLDPAFAAERVEKAFQLSRRVESMRIFRKYLVVPAVGFVFFNIINHMIILYKEQMFFFFGLRVLNLTIPVSISFWCYTNQMAKVRTIYVIANSLVIPVSSFATPYLGSMHNFAWVFLVWGSSYIAALSTREAVLGGIVCAILRVARISIWHMRDNVGQDSCISVVATLEGLFPDMLSSVLCNILAGYFYASARDEHRHFFSSQLARKGLKGSQGSSQSSGSQAGSSKSGSCSSATSSTSNKGQKDHSH